MDWILLAAFLLIAAQEWRYWRERAEWTREKNALLERLVPRLELNPKPPAPPKPDHYETYPDDV